MNEAASVSNTPLVEKLLTSIADVIGPEIARFARAPETETVSETERAVARLNFVETRRQANIDQVVRLAMREIGTADDKAPVDQGWLLRFFERAQDTCAELEQQVWARILARETEAPGTFGKRTLDFLAAMDLWELEGFIEYCAFSFTFESGWRFMFEGEIAQREMWAYGREIDLSQHLINIGLLSGETGLVKPTARGLRIHYRDRIYELRSAESPDRGASSFEPGFLYRKFTVTGQQLSEVIRTKSFFGYARNLIKALNAVQGMTFEPVDPPTED
jgi:hypothetical protein